MATRRTIGIREFRDHASRVVREVREERAEYLITVDGVPAAVLEPLPPEESEEERIQRALQWLDEWEELGREISAIWPPGVSAVDAVREQRREL